MHANEPLPACVRAYGKLKRGWRDTSLKARARPPLTADNETEGGGGELEREEKKGGGIERDAHRWLMFSSTFALLYLSTAFPIPTDWEDRGFLPAVSLSGDDHRLFSVPHRQSGLQ